MYRIEVIAELEYPSQLWRRVFCATFREEVRGERAIEQVQRFDKKSPMYEVLVDFDGLEKACSLKGWRREWDWIPTFSKGPDPSRSGLEPMARIR